MSNEGDVNQNISGDNNIQINSGNDSVITINNIEGIDPQTHAEALAKIEQLEEKVRQLETQATSQEINEQLVETSSQLEDLVEVIYPYPVLLILAKSCMNTGNYDKAEIYFSEVLRVGQELSDSLVEGWGYNGLGIVAEARGSLELAKDHYRKVQSDDKELQAAVSAQLGVVEYRTGNREIGVELFDKALGLFKEVGSLSGQANVLNSLGNVAKDSSDFDLALKYFFESIDLKSSLNDRMGLLNSNKNVAIVYRKMNLREKALSIYAEILTEAAYHDLKPLKAETYDSIANIFLDFGDYKKAEYNYGEAMKLHVEIGNQIGVGLSKLNLASLAINQDDFEEAMRLLLECKKIFEEHKSEYLERTVQAMNQVAKRMTEEI
ncbi:tetratricopeptide repeat protein [Candidatus Poseidoniales archaeon]|nr:tetratricopeptide repeat protein [Candidatus Poseidoniales archaeon]